MRARISSLFAPAPERVIQTTTTTNLSSYAVLFDTISISYSKACHDFFDAKLDLAYDQYDNLSNLSFTLARVNPDKKQHFVLHLRKASDNETILLRARNGITDLALINFVFNPVVVKSLGALIIELGASYNSITHLDHMIRVECAKAILEKMGRIVEEFFILPTNQEEVLRVVNKERMNHLLSQIECLLKNEIVTYKNLAEAHRDNRPSPGSP